MGLAGCFSPVEMLVSPAQLLASAGHTEASPPYTVKEVDESKSLLAGYQPPGPLRLPL